MRRLITFIMRLWLDVQAEPSTWEGEVECVTDDKRVQIRAPEELLAFIDAHTAAAVESPRTAGSVPGARPASVAHIRGYDRTAFPHLQGARRKRIALRRRA